MTTKNRQNAYPGFRGFAGEELEPGTLGIVAPQVEHLVEPQGAVRMFVEFHSLSEQGPVDPHPRPIVPVQAIQCFCSCCFTDAHQQACTDVHCPRRAPCK
jgi:hypothetical protein